MEYNTIESDGYAEDTTPYSDKQGFDEIIEKLEIDMSKICEWFHHSGFKANPGKSHFLLSPLIDRPMTVMRSTIKTSKEEVLLRVRIDSGLTFDVRKYDEYLSALKLIKNFID